ncbi:MAG: hypothetical protein WA633_12330 [Stellaceae bacterium]
MEKPQNGLLKLRQSGGRSDDSAADPQRGAETKAPPIGNCYELLDLIDEAFATLTIAMQSMMDFFDVSADQCELGLQRVRHRSIS